MTALSTALGGLLSPEQINELATDLTAPPDYSWQGVASDMGGDAFEAARYQVEQFAANGDLLPQTFVPVINAQGETTMVRVDFISNIFSPDQFMITLDGVTYANPQELKDAGWYAVNDLKQVAVSDGAGNLINSVFVPDGNGGVVIAPDPKTPLPANPPIIFVPPVEGTVSAGTPGHAEGGLIATETGNSGYGTGVQPDTQVIVGGGYLPAETPSVGDTIVTAEQNGVKGTITIDTLARPDENELRAGEALAILGYDVVHRATANDLGVFGERTSDLWVNGVRVDVYTPQSTTSINALLRAIERKNSQAQSVLIQGDFSNETIQEIAARTWGKPTVTNINTLIFQNNSGQIIRVDRP